jgi:predicted nucleic acid-binding protein
LSQAVLLDTGPLVALLDRRDRYHGWAKGQVATLPPMFHACEPVITEACFLLRTQPDGQRALMRMIQRRLIRIEFRLTQEAESVDALLRRYANVPMSLADACVVRMSEVVPDSTVFTLDGDFRIYRRHGRQLISLIMPPDR